jgi:hypothetical protein
VVAASPTVAAPVIAAPVVVRPVTVAVFPWWHWRHDYL